MTDLRFPDRTTPPTAPLASDRVAPVAERRPEVELAEMRPALPPPAPRPLIAPPAPSRSRVPDVVPAGYPLWELPAPLRRFCQRLDAAADAASAADGAVPLDLMAIELDQLELDLQTLAPWWIFDAVKYRRNLIRRTADYEALLLCWLPGQASPIHDHRGSGCAFRVVEGIVSETIYERAHGDRATAVAMRWLPPGTICASRDFDIHQVANAESRDLVTLHVYSPPLADVNIYRATETTQAS